MESINHQNSRLFIIIQHPGFNRCEFTSTEILIPCDRIVKTGCRQHIDMPINVDIKRKYGLGPICIGCNDMF
jgi:hypothetical protein